MVWKSPSKQPLDVIAGVPYKEMEKEKKKIILSLMQQFISKNSRKNITDKTLPILTPPGEIAPLSPYIALLLRVMWHLTVFIILS